MKLEKAIYIGSALAATHFLLKELRDRQPDIYYVDNIPGNFNGLTVPPIGIFIRRDQQGNAELLKHEMVHWKQYQERGLAMYYFDYAKGMIECGYDGHPMEKEARANEDAWTQANYTAAVRAGLAKTVQNKNFRS